MLIYLKNMKFQDVCSGKTDVPKEIVFFLVFSFFLGVSTIALYGLCRLGLFRSSHQGRKVLAHGLQAALHLVVTQRLIPSVTLSGAPSLAIWSRGTL